MTTTSIYRGAYYVEKRTGSFADNLIAFGLAYVLNGIANGRARITIEDSGPHFTVFCDPPLQEDWVKKCNFFTGAFMLITLDRKTGQKLIKGTNINPVTVAAMPGIAPDYEQAKADQASYWQWRKSVGNRWQQMTPPVEPHPDWELFRAINPSALQANNNAAAEWWRGKGVFAELLTAVLIYAAQLPNDEMGAAKHWAAICKQQNIDHKKNVTASQLTNPTQGKGIAATKAVFANPGNLQQPWLVEYLKWVGLRWAGFTCLIKDSKDRKVYVLAPHRLDWEHHLGIREQFRNLMVGSGSAIQLDALVALRYTKALLDYAQVANNNGLFTRLFGDGQGVNKTVYGLDSAYYKDLGQSVTMMNLARIGLPTWVRPQQLADIARYQAVLDEHIKIVRSLDERKGEQYELLRLYRDFLSASDLYALLAFTDAYASFVIQRDKLAPQLTVQHLEVIMNSIAPPLSKITQSRGFRNLAYAIRMATVEAHRRNLQRNQGKYDVSYEVRYGLGQELLRKAAYRNDFVVALSEFIHDYNAENARMRERCERLSGNANPRGSRSDVSIHDIDEILALMDEYGDPQMIASLLVAYGYASTYQRDKSYTGAEEAESDVPAGDSDEQVSDEEE
ncbi:hypothetical protein [Chloroflexus sp.]|uniref:hypothetical protein n=1 Tax=Chloroflexus sp. TaxID=1904827 RepID=UPI002ACD7224|nr:hypothetical protein [Chloroflexus sp.]